MKQVYQDRKIMYLLSENGVFYLFASFWMTMLKPFFGKRGKPLETVYLKRKHFRKWFWSYIQIKNECFECLQMEFFTFLQIFEWQSWNCFLGKASQRNKNYLNPKLVITSILENCFHTIFRSKTNNVLRV